MTLNATGNANHTVLIVDDDGSYRNSVAELLRRVGYHVLQASGGAEALATLAEHASSIDLALLDIRMPGMDGLETLGRIIRSYPSVPAIMLTGENAIDNVVQAMKTGATNYISKSSSGAELLAAVEQALRESAGRTAPIDARLNGLGIVAHSPALRAKLEEAARCARSTISVLVTGETGVGKDLVARAIHALSPRRDRPFIPLDVPNIPATMFESELFGHTRGAFTGAAEAKEGLVQAANGGTLFLDEIGEFPVELQAKFLRVLDTGSVRRLGSVTAEHVDVRIVSATNRNLLDAVRARAFREDLLYRLRGIEIHIPPLRERREDIAPLARHFLETFTRRNGMEDLRLNEGAIAMLERHHWPGNVRELSRAIEGAAVMASGDTIDQTDIARHLERGAPATPNGHAVVVQDYGDVQMLARLTKKDELEKILDRNDWNITRTAIELDIDRSTLSKQMKTLGIVKPRLGGTR